MARFTFDAPPAVGGETLFSQCSAVPYRVQVRVLGYKDYRCRFDRANADLRVRILSDNAKQWRDTAPGFLVTAVSY